MALAAVVARPTDQDADDLDLVAGVRADDERAFELLYLRYQPRITAYVRSMVHDHGRAEDITQDVFISALRRMRETDREIVFKPWVYEIAKNACIDAFRRTRHPHEVSFDAYEALGAGDHDRLAGAGTTPHRAIDAKVDLDNLRGAFGGLSEVHHQILVMRELEGLSYRDIGERLGMSRPAVESTLFRARRRLGEEYDELVSGKRCLRVRATVEAGGRSTGLRDQRRMQRHISHCQPCRRFALAAGVDLESRRSLRPSAARIAALLPLPAIARRPAEEQAAAQLLGTQSQATVAQWSGVAANVDPGTLVGWTKAVVAAATVAVAGVGAGAAITEREALRDFISRAQAISGPGGSSGPNAGRSGVQLRGGAETSRPAANGGAGRKSTGGATTTRPAGSAATGGSGATRPAKGAGHAHPANQAGAGNGKRQGAGSQGARRANPLGVVNEVLDGTLRGARGAVDRVGSSAPSTSGRAARVTGSVQMLLRTAGNSVSAPAGPAEAATRSSSRSVVSVASTVTTPAKAPPPGS